MGYAALGALVAIPISPTVAGLIEGAAGKVFSEILPQALLSLAMYLIALGLLWRLSGARFWHFRYQVTYPPILAVIPISLWMWVGLLFITDLPSRANSAIWTPAFFVPHRSACSNKIAIEF